MVQVYFTSKWFRIILKGARSQYLKPAIYFC